MMRRDLPCGPAGKRIFETGMFAVGGDSHSPTGGAFGCYMFGIGATEMAGCSLLERYGSGFPKRSGLNGKDFPERGHGQGRDAFPLRPVGNGWRPLSGSRILWRSRFELSMQERMTLSNMSAELGAQAGLIAPDATTMKWLEDHGSESDPVEPWQTDPDADFEYHRFDADQLEPRCRASQSSNAASVVEYNDIRPDVFTLVHAPAPNS